MIHFDRLYEEYMPSAPEPKDGQETYIDAEELLGQRVWVHTMLHNINFGKNGGIGLHHPTSNGTSRKSMKRYTNEIVLRDCMFNVKEKDAITNMTGKTINMPVDQIVTMDQSLAGKTGISQPTGSGEASGRNVYAGVTGTVVDEVPPTSDGKPTFYSPWWGRTFFYHPWDKDTPVIGADLVHFWYTPNTTGGKGRKGLSAWGVKYA